MIQKTPPKAATDKVVVSGNGGGAAPTDHMSATADEERHAIAVAVATAAAAAATAQAAVEVARLTRPSYHAREHYAAIVIQTAFRGYLVSQRF